MAAELGMSKTAYHLYESERGFKQRYLPMDLARRVAAILAERGVNPDEVLALAGIGIDEASMPQLSPGEERMLAAFRGLTADQRRLIQQMADQLAQTPAAVERTAAGVEATLHSGHQHYRSSAPA